MATRADIEAGKAFITLYLERASLARDLAAAHRDLLAFSVRVAQALNPTRWISAAGQAWPTSGKS
jgi:hypothetical protein